MIMKKILVPTDFSDCATIAVDMAFMVAKKLAAELIFLHLGIDKSGYAHVPGKSIKHIDAESGQARHQLDQLVKRAGEQGVQAKAELVLGTGREKIEDYIRPYDVEALIMGSHGATGFREAIIGSNTQRVIRNLKIPALVVKKPYEKTEIENIVFASRFKEDVHNAIKLTVDFVKKWDATVHLLFVNLVSHLIDEKIARLMMTKETERYPETQFTLSITETNDKEFGITDFAKKTEADIVAVALEPQSAVGRLLNPNLAEQLINHAPFPVLIVPE